MGRKREREIGGGRRPKESEREGLDSPSSIDIAEKALLPSFFKQRGKRKKEDGGFHPRHAITLRAVPRKWGCRYCCKYLWNLLSNKYLYALLLINFRTWVANQLQGRATWAEWAECGLGRLVMESREDESATAKALASRDPWRDRVHGTELWGLETCERPAMKQPLLKPVASLASARKTCFSWQSKKFVASVANKNLIPLWEQRPTQKFNFCPKAYLDTPCKTTLMNSKRWARTYTCSVHTTATKSRF